MRLQNFVQPLRPRAITTPGIILVLNIILGGTADKIEAAQVSLIKDINPGREGAFISYSEFDRFIEFNNELYFTADDGIHGIELWKYDGNDASLVADIRPGIRSSLEIEGFQDKIFAVFNETLYFSALLPSRGRELLKLNGNTVRLAADIPPRGQGSSPANLIVFNNALYFKTVFGNEGLWRFDGNTVTHLVDANYQLYDLKESTIFNNELYFQSFVGSNTDLWKFDGNHFSKVTTITENVSSYVFDRFAVFNNELFFNRGYQGLWKFDGTQIKQVTDSESYNLVVFKDSLYFTQNDNDLWRYDGSSISQVNSSSVPQYINNPFVFNNELYFSGYDTTHGNELWKYNGRKFSLVADIFPGTTTYSFGTVPNSSDPYDFIALGNELFFTAINESHGRELWKLTPTQAIPEPLTLLGASTAIGFGLVFKRKLTQKKN